MATSDRQLFGSEEHDPGEGRKVDIDIELGDVSRLEDLIDRDALSEVCRSFFELFGISLRIVSSSGMLMANVREEQSICRYMRELKQAQRACEATLSTLQAAAQPEGDLTQACFTGAVYRVADIAYQGRSIGRVILGPYLPAERLEVPATLLNADAALDAKLAAEKLAEMPRVREQTAERIVQHLRSMLDLLVFSTHRMRLTNEMHVASVRGSYRELAEKSSQLRTAFERLKELDRLKSNFLATVSHELRTPLTSIMGYAEMLETGVAGELKGEQLEFLATIRTKGDHLLALITRMLDLTKLEQGGIQLRREAVAPGPMLEEAAATLRPQAKRKKIEIEVEVDTEEVRLDADPTRLRQVLFNLLDNAVKFSNPGGSVRLRATLSQLEGPGSGGGLGMAIMAAQIPAICIEVEDTGPGIPAGDLDRIFDAFFQVDGSVTRQHGGAGIGLSIVQRLAAAHGGTVRVRSEKGAGTTFEVRWPVADETRP